MNKRLLIVLILLLAVAAYFYFNKSSGSIREEYKDFAIEDTSAIDRIFIADAAGVIADLNKVSMGDWTINNKYKARQDGIDLLLRTIRSIDVKEPVQLSAKEFVIKKLAAEATKVEIYTGGDRPAKVYYVGHATRSHHGTNMLLEIDGKKSSMPFITHVPGFFGFLSTRFFTDEKTWRHRGIFEYSAENIASIKMEYLEFPQHSFELRRTNDGFEVIGLQNQQLIDSPDEITVNEYLKRYEGVFFEAIDVDTPENAKDSVLDSAPLHHIEVKDINGTTTILNTYYKPVIDGTIDPATGEEFKHNIDRLYGHINNLDFVLVQWPTLDEILAYFEDFKKAETVEK